MAATDTNETEPPHQGLVARLRAALPRGGVLSPEDFGKRHRLVLGLLAGHMVAIFVFGLTRGASVGSLAATDAVISLFLLAAWQPNLLGARARAATSAIGLLVCSAVLVHLSSGSIEMHFHFFVMVAVIALYQDWLPFLLAIAFVALHHGLVGVMTPHDVYAHREAWSSPWRWAGIHAMFVLAASAAQVASWRMVEQEHDRAQQSLRTRERRFRALIEHSLDAVCIVSTDSEILYESDAAEKVLGFKAGTRTGQSGFAFVHPDDVRLAEALIVQATTAPGATDRAEVRGLHADGSWRWLDVRISNLAHEPDIGGLVVNYRDITHRRTLEHELAHQAFHDSLSGLANRALFLDRLDHALANQTRLGRGYLGVLYIDLDDFKTVNDALGHAAGDDLLREIAQRLQLSASLSDTCARLGGDEFALLLEGLESPADAQARANEVIAALRTPVTVAGDSISLSGSVGIVTSNGDDLAANLIRNADLAMYRAKRSGKGRCSVFHPTMHEDAVSRLALREQMRQAVEEDQFVNHYQPIVDLQSGDVLGAEALVRWEHPTRGLLGPDRFIDLAEETGLIVPIGRAVLERACADAANWPADQPLRVSVNLSARQLHEPTLVDDVHRALTQAGLEPARLTIEITESVLIEDPEGAAATLDALKALGVFVALDDFGTGFSSLSYLARFPVDTLKIDKSFIDALSVDGDRQERALVDAIIDMSRTLALGVTAEGIETPTQAARLVAMGCAAGQGFLYAKPMPHLQLLQRLRAAAVLQQPAVLDHATP